MDISKLYNITHSYGAALYVDKVSPISESKCTFSHIYGNYYITLCIGDDPTLTEMLTILFHEIGHTRFRSHFTKRYLGDRYKCECEAWVKGIKLMKSEELPIDTETISCNLKSYVKFRRKGSI